MESEEDVKLFISEEEELLQKLEDNLFNLEENPEDKNPVQDLFYIFHTLKGINAMAGFVNVSEFCHHFESILDSAKNKEISAENLTTFQNLFFQCLDNLRKHLRQIKEGDMTDLNSEIVKEIKEKKITFKKQDKKQESSETFLKPITIEKIHQLVKDIKNKFFEIQIRLQESCPFRKARLMIIIRELNEVGLFCWSNPSPEILDSGEIPLEFILFYISTKKINNFKQVLNKVSEIEKKYISELESNDFLNTVKMLIENRKKEELIKDIDSSEHDNINIDSIKVDVDVLEKLMNNFGEIVIIRNQINQLLMEGLDSSVNDLIKNMDKPLLDIQDLILKLNLIKVETTFKKYRGLIRDLSKETGKKIKFSLEGTDVKLDRKVLEELNVPIIHLLRNAIYHGIEPQEERKRKHKEELGKIKLKAYRGADSVFIEVSDDGKGIDFDSIRQKIIDKGYYSKKDAKELSEDILKKFILMPDFSTLSEVDIISGRGMGLKIVNDIIKGLGGSLRIHSEKDVGTTFTLIVPFTKAIFRAQLITVADDLFAIPLERIEQIYSFNINSIESDNQVKYYKIDAQKKVPLIFLDHYLKLRNHENKSNFNKNIKIGILCHMDEKHSAILALDEVLEQTDVIVKPFKSDYSDSDDFLGSAITGDGSICLILNVSNIISSTLKETQSETEIIELNK